MVIFVQCSFFKKDSLLNNKFKTGCYKNECKNGSKCLPFGSSYECKCRNDGYSGKHCEHCTFILSINYLIDKLIHSK